ncbi:hypothetical protein [Natrarchaeobius chitinivorans]|uniref:Uncharacterized protein n=1 Tax=Natrarchaeobius chitinivorans TaxID=1679083 RepID=A0A3N6M097_NATCH|nr:hypothetical protein [Natrarchaeobius chitinivorans]RQG96643.1 hypothetical protein EA473_05925 [Natrarchaeobius chitinivorans]
MDPIDVDVSGPTVRAVDLSDSTVEIETMGWDTPAPAVDLDPIPRRIHASVSGRASELVFPAVHANVFAIEDDSIVHLFDVETERETVELPERCYYFFLLSRPLTVVRFDGTATLQRRSDQRLGLSFDHSTVVTLGFSDAPSYPRHTITVAPTTDGLATALSHLSAPLGDSGVQNASLAREGHPPLLEFGDETVVPDAVAGSVPETGIELIVPDGPEWLFPATPFAYYLGATVTTADRDRPVIRAPAVGLTHEFDPLPEFQIQVGKLVRRTFQLDLLVKTRYDALSLSEWSHFSEESLDVDRLEGATNAERLRTYLELPESALETALPEWKRRWYVDPTIENATVLPFALNDIGLVLQPDVADRFGDAPGQNETGVGRGDPVDFEPFVGWFADSEPDHAYQGRIQGFENELEFVQYRDADVRRVVVVNDPDRASAAEATTESFRERPPDPLPVEVHRNVSHDELADLLSTPTDLLHFVGDCDGSFACPDGTLDPAHLEDVDARLLVLDGPDSVDVGEAVIEHGSVAAVVRQPDREPTLSSDVRRLFFNLLAAGFPLNYARLVAEQYAAGRSDLGIVGAGLARIAENDPGNYGHLHGIEPAGDGRFVVEDYAYVKRPGYYWNPDFPDAESTFTGKVVRNTTDAAGIKALVRHTDDPIVYDGRIYWPDPDDLFYPLA